MKKVIKVVALLVIFLSFFSFVSAEDVYTVNQHDYQAVVNEDGTIDIVETVIVTFNQKKHGIIINLPTTYQKNWQINGETYFRQYYFPITNVKVLSNQTSQLQYLDNGVQIVFGSEDSYANQQEIYLYSYTMVTRDLDLNGLQMVFLNIITSGWSSTTESCSFTIQFPKDFSDEAIRVAYPVSAGNGLELLREGNTLIGYYNGIIRENEGITLQVVLGTDYFAFEDFNALALKICLAAFCFVLFGLFVYLLKGKDKKITADGKLDLNTDLDSSLAGLLIDEEMNEKDLISLILYWGNKGYLKIVDLADEVQLVKLKSLNENSYRYQKILFKTLFEKGDEVKLSQIKNKLAQTVTKLIEDTNKAYAKSKRKLSDNSSVIIQSIMIFINFLISGIFVSFIYYRYCYLLKNTLIILLIEFVGLTTICYLSCTVYRKRLLFSKVKQLVCYAGLALLLLANAVFVWYVLRPVKLQMVYEVIIFGLQLLSIIITMAMRRRNKAYYQHYQTIINIKQAITTGEFDKKDSELYFALLPYSYAFGLTESFNGLYLDQDIMENDCFEMEKSKINEYSYLTALLLTITAINDSVISDDILSGSNASNVNCQIDKADIDSGFGGSNITSW
ncbi:MAG: DUF2207 domain-containing protein [Erysipelotrichaceae bacterium]